MTDSIQKIQIDYISNGADKAAADYDRVTAAESRLNALEQQATVVKETLSRSQLSVTTQLDRYVRSLDPVSRALADVERGERLVSTARAQGASVTASAERALENARRRYQDLTNALNDNAHATGANRTQMMMLQSTLSNTASSLGSGASPLQVLMQQAPDLMQAFGGGGLGGALKSVKDSIASMITPSRALGVTLAGAGLAAASSFWRAHEAQLALSGSMIGAGRGTGLTLSGLNAAATQGAASSGGYLSLSSAREATAAMASTGTVDRSIIGGSVGNVERFARISGQEIPDATKTLAAAFADPSKGAVELNKSLGFLNDKLAQTIKNLQESGDVAGAQRALFDAWKQSVEGAAETIDKNRSAFSKAWNWTKNTFSDADTALGDRLNGPSREDQLATYRRQLEKAQNGEYIPRVANQYLTQNPSLIAELERSLQTEQSKAEANKKDAADNALSLRAGSTIRKYASESQTLQDLVNARDELAKLATNAEALAKTGTSSEQAATALRKLNTAVTAFETPIQKVATDSLLATRQTEAYTFAEKSAVAAELARVQSLRSSSDTLLAAAEAEKARNQLIADGTAKAKEFARGAADDLSLAGLKSYQRAHRQVDIDQKNFRDQYIPTGAAQSTPAAGSMAAYAAAIAKIESGGNYGAIGPETKSGDHAYGKYQVMGANIPSWTRMAGGQSLTPEQFLANPSIQEAVFAQQFGRSVSKYGNAQDAASVWLTGRPLARAGNARDVNGTSAADYAAKFNAALGLGGGAQPTAAAVYGLGADDKHKSIDISQIFGPFDSARDSIKEMASQTDLMRATFGKSAEEIAAANEVEKLRNTYMRAGITETTLSGEALKKYNEHLAETGRYSLQENRRRSSDDEQRAKVTGMYDLTRSTTGDMISSPLKAIVRGQSVGSSMKDAGLRMVDKVVDMGTNSLTDIALGKSGTFGGLFGNQLSSLFGNGSANTTTNAAMATINASTANIVGGASVGSLASGAGASGATSAFGSVGDWFKNLFADGGVMSSSGPIPLRRYASGGVANSAQMAIFGEGSMNEAYVPLPDGRSIPVSMRSGSGSQAVNVSHTVHNYAGAEVQTKATRQANGHVQMETLITGIVQKHLSNNGSIARSMQNTYGLSRATGKV